MKIKPVSIHDLEYRLSRASCELIDAMRAGCSEATPTLEISKKWNVTIDSLRDEATKRLHWFKRISEAPKEQE